MIGAQAGVAGVAAASVFAVKKAADFESQLSSLGSVADANAKQMGRFRKQALKAGADTKFSALEAAQAQTELAKGGLSVKQIMRGGLKSSLALAAAGQMDLAEAAEATVNAMKLFKIRGKDSMKVADGFATAANRTTADVSDFAMALKQGGGAAQAAGLNFKQTTSWLEALAEVGVKNSDAGTSMKAALAQLAAPTEKQQKLAKKLNVEFFDQHGNMKSLTDVSKMLRDRLGGLTKEQRLNAVKTLAGTDGMRALLALYDSGPKKIGKFQAELGKQGTAADVAKKKQDNLKGSLEQLGGSLETLGIQVGTLFIPALREGAGELRKFADKIGRVAGRKDLSLGEKLQKSIEIAKVDAKPWLDKLKAAIEKANVPQMIADGLSAAAPIVAKAAAQAGITGAKTFASAFVSTDAWGKVILGGWLLRRMGGTKAFFAMGATAGSSFGAGMASTGGLGAIGGGKIKGLLGGLKGLAGRAVMLDFGINLLDSKGNPIAAAINTAHDLSFGIVPKVKVKSSGEKIDDQFKGLSENLDALTKKRDVSGLEALTAKMRGIAAEARDFGRADLGKAWDKLAAKASTNANKIAGTSTQIESMSDRFKAAIRGMRLKGSEDFDGLVKSVTFGSKRILKVGGHNSAEARKEISKQFDIAARRVQTAMDNKVISVKEGTSRLRELARKELKLYGISAGKVDVVLAKGANGQARPHQRGAYINEGAAHGDSVPAMLERGEYVLNRKAVKRLGKGKLDRLNFGQAPRFQEGGIVELLHPDNDPAGHGGGNSHLHIAMLQGIVALGRKLQNMGWLVSENPAFGGVGGMHAKGGYHYTGQAIDVNWPIPGEELAKIRALLPMLGGAGAGALGRVFEGLDRPQLRGPASVGLEAGQGALDRILSAANASIENAVGSTGMEGVEGAGFSGPWTKVMAQIAKGKGWSLAAWQRLVQKESGGNPAARNPSSGAFGLGQFLGSTAQAYAKYGALSSNPVEQIQAMAKYIGDRYGNPTAALAFHDKNNWYSQGGPIGMAAGGGIGKALGKVQRSKSPKVRGGAIRKLLGNIKGIGLPDSLTRDLSRLSGDADTFGDYADRASQLSVTGDNGSFTEGIVGGKTQAQWLTDQLTALFQWRNRIIDAEEIVVDKREQIRAMLERARTRLAEVRAQIEASAKLRKRLAGRVKNINKQLDTLRKHPNRNREKITRLVSARDELGSMIQGIDGEQKGRGRVKDALTGKIIPALTTQRTGLNTARGDLLTNLETVQGVGSPMGRLTTLPDVGVLGGSIFDVQMRLRDLTAERARVTDTDTPDDGGRADTLAQLLRESNLRTAVSQAQYKVFRDMPSFGGGGIVPGPVGSARIVEAHGGEGVFTPDQMSAIGGTGTVNLRVIVVEGGGVEVWQDNRRIDAAVERVTRQQARGSARGLPGRGGGGF